MSGDERTTMATLDGGDGGGEGGLIINTTLSLASRLNKRADLLRRIFSFHETRNPSLDYIDLRSSSNFFHKALPPPPLWTTFPCSNHATLQSLVNRLEELQGDEESRGNVPSVLFIEKGDYGGEGNFIMMKKPLSIIGAGRGMTTLVGIGLRIEGNKSAGIVEIEDLTIKGVKEDGLCADEGMKVIMRGCSVEDCEGIGVFAEGADISCDDLQVVGCGLSGVWANGTATITLSGQGTSIQRNVTNGDSDSYGLDATNSSSIHLVLPLTKEEISTDNGGSGNWGGDGTIEQVSK